MKEWIDNLIDFKEYTRRCTEADSIKVKCIHTKSGYWHQLDKIYNVYKVMYRPSGTDIAYYMSFPYDGQGIGETDAIVYLEVFDTSEIVGMFKEI